MTERRLILVPLLCAVAVAVAACSSSGKPASTPSTTPATRPNAVDIATGKPGQKSVFVIAADLGRRTITVDPIEFLSGEAAVAEYHKLNPGSAGGVLNDYAIVNSKIDNNVLPLAPNAVLRLVHVRGKDHTKPVKVPLTALVGYKSLSIRPFWITVTNGTVTEVDEQFVP
jgi:hypothetical protein